MFNKLFLLFLPLAACASGMQRVDDNTFYHQTNIVPTITEVPTETGRLVTIHNPFGKILSIELDCIEETTIRKIVIPASGEFSFNITTNDQFFDMACSIEHGWQVQ